MTDDARAAAEAALEGAWANDSGVADQTQTPAPAEQAQTAAPVASEGQTGATEQDKPDGLFYGIDPNQLTPEMRQMFDGMQKAFTERMQEAAPLAKAVEAYGGPERVEQALDFVSSLQDPENLIQLRDEISEYLQDQGLSKAEADAAATQGISDGVQSEPADDSFGFEDDRTRALEAELDELRQWREGMEEERQIAQAELALQRSESVIREQHPEYTDDDIRSIYERAYAYGGDLNAAHDSFESERSRILQAYAAAKEQVSPSVAPVTAGIGGQEGEKLSFDDAHKHAKSVVQGLLNEGHFGS